MLLGAVRFRNGSRLRDSDVDFRPHNLSSCACWPIFLLGSPHKCRHLRHSRSDRRSAAPKMEARKIIQNRQFYRMDATHFQTKKLLDLWQQKGSLNSLQRVNLYRIAANPTYSRRPEPRSSAVFRHPDSFRPRSCGLRRRGPRHKRNLASSTGRLVSPPRMANLRRLWRHARSARTLRTRSHALRRTIPRHLYNHPRRLHASHRLGTPLRIPFHSPGSLNRHDHLQAQCPPRTSRRSI